MRSRHCRRRRGRDIRSRPLGADPARGARAATRSYGPARGGRSMTESWEGWALSDGVEGMRRVGGEGRARAVSFADSARIAIRVTIESLSESL